MNPNENKQKKYEVTILESDGTCATSLFEKMAKLGDITAEKVTECIGKVVKITGYAMCHIKTEEKDFKLGYYATDDGFISTGSEIFYNSVVAYKGEVEKFKIQKVRTRKGTTYKAVPILELINEVDEIDEEI